MTRRDASVLPEVAGLERDVLEAVWDHDTDGATVRDVLDTLNGRDDKQRAYTTIMTVLARLHEKGLVERHRDGNANVYTPAVTREQYQHARASAHVDALVSEYGEVALAHFARRVAEQDPRHRARLRRLARGT